MHRTKSCVLASGVINLKTSWVPSSRPSRKPQLPLSFSALPAPPSHLTDSRLQNGSLEATNPRRKGLAAGPGKAWRRRRNCGPAAARPAATGCAPLPWSTSRQCWSGAMSRCAGLAYRVARHPEAHPSDGGLLVRLCSSCSCRRSCSLPHTLLAQHRPSAPTKQMLPAVYRFIGASWGATPTQLGYLTLCRALVQALSSPLGGIAGKPYSRNQPCSLEASASMHPMHDPWRHSLSACGSLALTGTPCRGWHPPQATACTAAASWAPAACSGRPAQRRLPAAAAWPAARQCGRSTA